MAAGLQTWKAPEMARIDGEHRVPERERGGTAQEIRERNHDAAALLPSVQLACTLCDVCRQRMNGHRGEEFLDEGARPQSRHSSPGSVPRRRGERFTVTGHHRFKVAPELAVERGARAALLCEAKRLGQQPDIRRGRAKHCHGFGISLDNNFGAGAYVRQE
jgi:hypothetical protein